MSLIVLPVVAQEAPKSDHMLSIVGFPKQTRSYH